MVTYNYPNTGSTLSVTNGEPQGANKTSTSLSTNIIIKVGTIAVGAIQTIGITEARPVRTIPEVGTDGFIDSAPNASTNITVNCTRIRFDRLRIAQAFSRGFIHATAQRYPFDIEIYDQQSLATTEQIVTTVKNCWITNINYSYSATDWIISETMNCQAETIYSVTVSSGQNVSSIKTSRQTQYFIDQYEQAADVGLRRGALDAPGLIDLAVTDSPLF